MSLARTRAAYDEAVADYRQTVLGAFGEVEDSLAAERWLERFSWIALVAAIVAGITAAILLRERTSRAIAELEAEHQHKMDTTAADAA